MKIDIPQDCENSPRKQFIKNFNLAFANADIEFIIDHVSEDFEWEMIGDRTLSGKGEVRQFLESMAAAKSESIRLHSIITHGREAACNGEIAAAGSNPVAFCDVYTFKDTKNNMLINMRSYGIELQSLASQS